MYKTPTHRTWHMMKCRCKGTSDERNNKLYHDKGITVCKRWEKFENFFEDMGIRPNGMELDRIDSKGNYCKDNCRWVTKAHNLSNKIYIKKSNLPRGVVKARKRYQAIICVNNKQTNLGSFKTIKNAESVFLDAYLIVYGELPPEYRKCV